MIMPVSAMLNSVENLAKLDHRSPFGNWLTTDHRLFHILHTKLTVGLPAEQHQVVDDWQHSQAGRFVIDVISTTLAKSWREIPTTLFGDSSTIKFGKNTKTPIVSFMEQWLQRKTGKVTSYAICGYDSIDWANAFYQNKMKSCLPISAFLVTRTVCVLHSIVPERVR